MIRISAVYPNAAGSRFDSRYYVDAHAVCAADLLRPHGLVSIRTTVGTAALDGSPPPFWAISEMVFGSREAFDGAILAAGEALFADVRRCTDVEPVLQLSELHSADQI